jgi:pyruvate,water dikinase
VVDIPVPLAKTAGRDVQQIGGKAASLVRLQQAGFAVPEAFVIPVDWFAPWWDALRETEAWGAFARASTGPWRPHCESLQAEASRLEYGDAMRAALEEVRAAVTGWNSCAVRSSSPEEDLEGASFAGEYATVLGVAPAGLEDAVRACFVSALGERLFVYKEQRGFDVHRPRIAVVVQRQVESEVAGVAFSLNPMTNDYDEAVVDASFGLGETVVSGEVTPDHWVVDKPDARILERRLGSKGVQRSVAAGGGVERSVADRADEACLTDAQVLELVETLDRVEALYGVPIDVEWARADGELHLLQARPITTHYPLPAEMLTEPGERRRLYVDRALTDGFTTNTPLARLTLDMGQDMFRQMCAMFAIPWVPNEPPDRDLILLGATRVYVDYSQIFWWVSPQKIAAPAELLDQLLARTLMNVDRERYMPEQRPVAFSPGRFARGIWGVLRKGGRVLWRSFLPFFAPVRFLRGYRAACKRYRQMIRDVPVDGPTEDLLALHGKFIHMLLEEDLPVIYPWSAALWLIESMRKRSDPETSVLLDKLTRGIEGEIVIDMGIDMYRMARQLGASEFEDLEALVARIEAGEMPERFLADWDAFIRRYGCRGPMEMDLRSPRYGDTPVLALRQMSFMANGSAEHDPERAHRHNVEERKRAYGELMQRSGRWRRMLLRRAHRWIELFSSERDNAKHHWVMIAAVMRRHVLARGGELVEQGRLDAAEDVFHLTFEELTGAQLDPEFDLRAPVAEHGEYFRRVEAQVREFPHAIDSRGRIIRPAPGPDDGALHGLGISPGVASGPIKVLADPYQKDVEPGDVLVAYTTDPGWTPLFVNAAAIILQVGGVMQHGGVVAREYGKPCVAGIEHVLTRFEDGQMVEVDGSDGTVRLI